MDTYAAPRWIDHPYRLRLPAGDWSYVAEPYHLDEEALEDVAYLMAEGFDVYISAGAARHCPGGTVAVVIEQPGIAALPGHADQ